MLDFDDCVACLKLILCSIVVCLFVVLVWSVMVGIDYFWFVVFWFVVVTLLIIYLFRRFNMVVTFLFWVVEVCLFVCAFCRFSVCGWVVVVSCLNCYNGLWLWLICSLFVLFVNVLRVLDDVCYLLMIIVLIVSLCSLICGLVARYLFVYYLFDTFWLVFVCCFTLNFNLFVTSVCFVGI